MSPSRPSMPPVAVLTHLGEVALHSKAEAPVKPKSKAAGLMVHVSVALDPERQEQWHECPDFRRALRENLAETYPAADRIILTGRGLRTLETFRPEDHLPDEKEETTRFVRTAVVKDEHARDDGPITSEIRRVNAERKVEAAFFGSEYVL